MDRSNYHDRGAAASRDGTYRVADIRLLCPPKCLNSCLGVSEPRSLAVQPDGSALPTAFRSNLGGVDLPHYTIAPARDMPLDEFKGLLDQLAILLIREAA